MAFLAFRYPKGHVQAKGYFFGLDTSEKTIQCRVLSLWQKGSKLYQFECGFVLLQNQVKTESMTQCLGVPLIDNSGVLSNVLLDETFQPKLEAVDNKTLGSQVSVDAGNIASIFVLIEGELKELVLSNAALFDPSVWLDFTAYTQIETQTLGLIKKPQVIAPKKDRNVRDALGDATLTKSSDLNKALAQLEKISQLESESELNAKDHKIGLVDFLLRLKRSFRSVKVEGDHTQSHRESYSPYVQKIESTSLWSKIKLSFSEFLMASTLAKAIGKSNAKHVQRMMDLFDDGDLDEALRNAIPLTNMRDALSVQAQSLTLRAQKLPDTIQPYAQAGGKSVPMDVNVLHQMRLMYERAFKKLDQEGNYTKAAFILAELLRDIDRAVEYLEKNQEFRLAAELAEGQKLDPARIIRQWVLAKEISRAMEVAVISGHYQQAITLLQDKYPKEADDLRWYCANLHFKARNFQTAVDIAWPIQEKRNEVIGWMKLSSRLGGEVGMTHLLRLALHDKENYKSYLIEINARFENDQFREGLALIDEIIQSGKQETNQRIASMAARYYLSAASEGLLKFDRKRWNQLCLVSGDLTLRADVIGINFQPLETLSAKKDKEDSKIKLIFSPTFGREAEDCVSLLGGQHLLAFGESGVELWDAKGELIKRFSVPCHDIVVSDQRNSALFIARRSGYQIIHKFDLKDNSVKYWLELDIHCWSNNFDGHTWIVSHKDKVFVLEVLKDDQSTIWSIDELPGFVTSIVRTNDSFSLCLSAKEQFQVWVYDLPNLYLQERSPHRKEQLDGFLAISINEKGDIIGVYPKKNHLFGLFEENAEIKWVDLKNDIQSISYVGGNVFLISIDGKNTFVDVFPVVEKKLGECSLCMCFEDTKTVDLRVCGKILSIFSTDGRVVTIDLIDKRVSSDFVLN